MPSTSPTATPDRTLCVLELPAELRSSDAQLHSSAARLLELPPVRSVSIDGRRATAIIRLHASRSTITSPADIFTQLSTELAHSTEVITPIPSPQIVSWIDPRTQTLCFIKLPKQVSGWRRIAFLAGAALSLFLGLLGIVLPGLPTTPFVLVASYCLLRSSPKLHERLLHDRLFGGVLRDWHLCRGIRPHVRYKALAVIAIVVAASLLLGNLSNLSTLFVAAIAACGIIYVWCLPNIVE